MIQIPISKGTHECINVREKGNKGIIFPLSKLMFKKPDPPGRNLVKTVHWLDAQSGTWRRGVDKKKKKACVRPFASDTIAVSTPTALDRALCTRTHVSAAFVRVQRPPPGPQRQPPPCSHKVSPVPGRPCSLA